jgi:hypothetical protein
MYNDYVVGWKTEASCFNSRQFSYVHLLVLSPFPFLAITVPSDAIHIYSMQFNKRIQINPQKKSAHFIASDYASMYNRINVFENITM